MCRFAEDINLQTHCDFPPMGMLQPYEIHLLTGDSAGKNIPNQNGARSMTQTKFNGFTRTSIKYWRDLLHLLSGQNEHARYQLVQFTYPSLGNFALQFSGVVKQPKFTALTDPRHHIFSLCSLIGIHPCSSWSNTGGFSQMLTFKGHASCSIFKSSKVRHLRGKWSKIFRFFGKSYQRILIFLTRVLNHM